MKMQEMIKEMRSVMGEDKDISIKLYDNEIAFYLFEKEIGIYLNKYNYNYHPYIDLEGCDGVHARLGFKEIQTILIVMVIIENNLEEILSWINVDSQ